MGNDFSLLTLIIPNRNRDLKTVGRSLQSLFDQQTSQVEVYIVDYGSALSYQQELKKLLKSFPTAKTIFCPFQGQLWNKSRAINMVLRQCKTPYFMVVDIDMIYHPQFISRISVNLDPQSAYYFPVGVLKEEESKKDLAFADYQVKFITGSEATGITLFPTQKLMQINGYDEFYHGWGSEDTDVHVRLRHAGTHVVFKNEDLLFLHQWHPKIYRSTDSTHAFHGLLERINARYLKLTEELKISKANLNLAWGILPQEESYLKLDHPDIVIDLNHTVDEVSALCFQLSNITGKCIKISIAHHLEKDTLKNKIKKIIGKKRPLFFSAEKTNAYVLEMMIAKFRNCPYYYHFDRKKKIIILIINI